MAAMKHNSGVQSTQVQDRLLDAAEKFFCEKGFDRTSVRDLTRAAGCNVAAVNYYFGGKDKLYIQMFRRQLGRMMQGQREVISQVLAKPDTVLEDLLRESVRQALTQLHPNGQGGAVMKLMVREVLNHHVDREQLLGSLEQDFYTLFAEAFMKFCPSLSLRQARLLFFSLDALVVHPLLFHEFYYDVDPDFGEKDMIEHIVRFASAGIRAYTRGGD